ncbi:LytTR family DNA-binding domain-containing protein [Flavobacteriaceae bacterium 3-367]
MRAPKLRAYIVEPDPRALQALLSMLKQYFPEIQVLGSAPDVARALSKINTLAPDIVFLEIALKNSCGFQLIERYGRPCSFIITSSVDTYALKAIALNVTAYLLKPLDLKEVLVAINKAKQQLLPSYEGYAKDIGTAYAIDILALPSKDKVELVAKKDIVYLKAEGRYTQFLLRCGAAKLASRNLGSFARLLPPNRFIRVHHSYLVNMAYVTHLDKAGGYYLELMNGRYIPVSKRKLEVLNRFLGIK